ncbi:CDP-alcohol phosphatidyltransferase family protein [uncultured Desulfobulbus sp.]|uniref:CDP-alcohol phosphatidyltransferase family protein n=1 Tax=uncultured Desulfobulbus sp. TaxID=239745 RepID=UPI0029C98762|nr:CDP-alcohol phosphatidyltransferase family protein [uncultured Desulfobulbus sp.]
MTASTTSAGRSDNVPAWRAPGRVPSALRRQAWLAAALLFCPWLVTLFLCGPLLQLHLHPFVIVSLLPGLIAAIYLHLRLIFHLGSNHRYGEADRPFPTLGAATWITLLRGAAIVALAGFLPLAVLPVPALPQAQVWAPGLIYLTISLADLLDGFVARRQHRQTELGQRLDIETDAAGLMVALLVAVSLDRLPALTLLVGLAYYLFLFGIWWRQQRHLPLVALQLRPYARIIAGFQMGLVAMALLPLFNPPFTSIAAALVMTPLLVGFGRDWLVVSCRLRIDSNQRTAMDQWAGLVLTRFLPLVLRLLLLAGGIVNLVQGAASLPHPAWLWAQSLCCLLAGIGWMGRSAALLLTLALSCSLAPYGTGLPVLVLFGIAATLMLTGTGPLSLWSPEEGILYRRRRDSGIPAGNETT